MSKSVSPTHTFCVEHNLDKLILTVDLGFAVRLEERDHEGGDGRLAGLDGAGDAAPPRGARDVQGRLEQGPFDLSFDRKTRKY